MIIVLVVAVVIMAAVIRGGGMPTLSGTNAQVLALKRRVLNDKDLGREISKGLEDSGHKGFYAVFLSVSNAKTQARVFHGTGATLKAAWLDADAKAAVFVKDNDYVVRWAKADIVDSLEDADTSLLGRMLADKIDQQNFFRKGIALDEDFNIAFLEVELNGNRMLDYSMKQRSEVGEQSPLRLKNINGYLEQYELERLDVLPSKQLLIFTTRGFFCDESGEVFDLYSNAQDFGRRVIDDVNSEVAKEIITNASDYLYSMLNPDGSFQYGYWPVSNKKMAGYNILRHTGSIWSLINLYRMTGNESLRPKIQSALDYLVNVNIEYMDDQTAFVVERKDGEIKLGGNGIALVALTEYMDVFQSEDYIDLVVKLANGVMMLQNENGSYYHVLNFPGFTSKAACRTVYYDGEATFGLTRAYTFTKDQRYLDAAARAVDYFIKKDYTKYSDHWIAYALNEITKYIPREDYYTFALQNVWKNLRKIYGYTTTFHTYLELLTAGWQTYQRLLDSGMQIEYLDEFDPAQVAATIYKRARHMLNGYFWPEYAMYMKNPDEAVGAFFVRHDNFRIRIDDIQHFIGAYYMYSLEYDGVVKYLNQEFLSEPAGTLSEAKKQMNL